MADGVTLAEWGPMCAGSRSQAARVQGDLQHLPRARGRCDILSVARPWDRISDGLPVARRRGKHRRPRRKRPRKDVGPMAMQRANKVVK